MNMCERLTQGDTIHDLENLILQLRSELASYDADLGVARAEVQELVSRLSARDACISEQGAVIRRNLEDFAAKVGINL